MNHLYLIKDKKPYPVDDAKEWAEGFDRMDAIVEKTDIAGIHISTVFLGIDHSYGQGPPLLFETMIFGGEHDMYQDRYTTWEQAEEGHHIACELVIESL